MKTYSEILSDYIYSLNFENLPREVVSKCKHIIIDTLGVMLFGSNFPSSQIVKDFYLHQGGAPEASIVGSDIRLPASNAAFVNGTMAHSFDYDDDLAACHIATCVLPAALAVAQRIKASGRELMTSIVIGYDLIVRTAETLDGHHLYAMGLHPTPICGTVGAAGSVSKLLRLDPKQITNALGITGSFTSGSLEWLSDGSMTKRFHGGKAASEGIIAASLAERGFSSPRTIFEGDNGILKIYQAQRAADNLVKELGNRYDILKSYIKYYPCCTCNAPIIDAVLELKNESSINYMNIDEIEVKLRKTCFALVGMPIDKKRNPQTILDAQMSAPYCVAVALLDGEVFPAQFAEDRLKDPLINKIMNKVNVKTHEAMEISASPRPVPAEVTIRLSNGVELAKRIDYQRGTYLNPLSDTELRRKFSICAKDKLSKKQCERLLLNVERLENIDDISALFVSKEQDV